MGKIYCAENTINGHRYVGFTSRKSIDGRVYEHLYAALTLETRTPFYAAIRKYGEENFTWFLLYEGKDAKRKENKFIRDFGYYNMVAGGIGGSLHLSVRKKISRALRGVKHLPERIEANRRGQLGLKRPHTKEHNEKISRALMGHKVSKESRERMRQSRLNFLKKNGV